MTRGFHHPAETFFKNHLHAARSCSRPPKICRLQPSAGSAEALKNLSFSPPREGVPTLPESPKTTLTHCRSIYYICIYQIFSLLLRHEKGVQHGIEKVHRGGPGETHPKTQAAPSGNGARRGSRLHGARGETSRADPCRRCLEPQSCPQDEEIEKLKARIAELEGGAKPVAKTGANSSVPPSRNPIGVPHTRSQRKPSGRKTGWQRGIRAARGRSPGM